MDKVRINSLWLAHDFNCRVTFHHFLPEDRELEFGQTIAHASVNPKAERHVLAGASTVNDEIIGTVDHIFVAVTRRIPHHDFVAFFDLLARKLCIGNCGPTHMEERRLPANHLRDHARDQRGILA